jgi:penicillin-binding protein 1A
MILEAFKPGTAPPDSYSIIGVSDTFDGRGPYDDRYDGRVPYDPRSYPYDPRVEGRPYDPRFEGRPMTVSPEADRAIRSGTGGLY